MVSKTGATPLTMRDVKRSYYMALSKQQATSVHRLIASEFDTDQPQEEYPWLSEARKLIKWEGERSFQKLRSDTITLVNEEWETGIPFKKRDFIRDKTGQMKMRVAELAADVAYHPMDLLTDLIVANGNAYDGKTYFAADHAVGSSGTIDNTLDSGELAGGADPTTAQQSENVLKVFSRLLGFKNSAGRPLNEVGKQFVVMTGPDMWGKTVAGINAAFTTNSQTNPLTEVAKMGVHMTPVLNARLTGSTWYMFRIDAGIRPFIVQQEDTVPVTLDLDSEHCIKTNEVYFGHGWAGQAGYGRFELACRAVPV